MLEPALAFRTAVRAALLASAPVVALVPAENIRAGASRPENLPCILLSDGTTRFLGRAAGGQLVAEVTLQVYIWAVEAGAETAQAIGAAALAALLDAPPSPDFATDDYEAPSIVWMRDPQPSVAYTHGAMQLGATIRWRI